MPPAPTFTPKEPDNHDVVEGVLILTISDKPHHVLSQHASD